MNTRRRSRGMSPLAKFATAVAILAAGGLLTFGGLRYFGLLNTVETPTAQAKSREGMVRVPKSLAALKAFTKVRREDIHDLALGDDSYFWLPKDVVQQNPGWILNRDEIIGRVLAHDKEADFVFQEKDFLPKGSSTGLSAGVPPDKQGFFLKAEQIPGLRLLKMGDRFDLLASLPEESQNADAEYGLLTGGIKARGGKPIPLNGVRLLVQDGQMVALTGGSKMTTQGGLEFSQPETRGRRSANQNDEQVTIAIDPSEVARLTQALGADLAIHCIARSGQSNEKLQREDPLEGMVAFPATARSVEAFSEITAADLTEPLTGELRQYYYPPEAVRDGWLPTVDQLVGRVVRRDIDAGYIFSESDFLPANAVTREIQAYTRIAADDLADPAEASEWVGRVAARALNAGEALAEKDLLPAGASPGVSGGTPAGRMALTVPSESVRGLNVLSQGDRFYVITSVPFDIKKEVGSNVQLAAYTRGAGDIHQKATNTVLAEDAILVEQNDGTITIAVRGSEVAGITKALSLGLDVFSVAQSGRTIPADVEVEPTEAITSDPNPIGEVAIVEMLIGGKRTVQAFRKSER